MARQKLLQFTSKGIYCAIGKFYIDPWRPVPLALITHAHADHCRYGMGQYVAHTDSEPIMRLRVGQDISCTTYGYHQPFSINGVNICFYPAGHVIGSCQIRVEYKGEIWVASGDYKLGNDGVSTPFEPVKCHTFITESTFGLPVFKWASNADLANDINTWWANNAANGITSVLAGYSLGKAQRLLQLLDTNIGTIYTHGAIENITQAFRNHGVVLQPTTKITSELGKGVTKGGIVLAPPSVIGSSWLKKLEPYSDAIASGWMGLRGARRRRAVDRGFVLSDHADFEQLNQAITATEAETVYVTHGYTAAFSRWLNEKGIEAHEAKTEYTGETLDIEDVAIPPTDLPEELSELTEVAEMPNTETED